MFNDETCRRCGRCLSECPFIEMAPKKAKSEIERIIESGELGDIASLCIACGYCDFICPTQSNPSDLRRKYFISETIAKGASGMFLMQEDVPANLMLAALAYETNEKKRDLDQYTNPPQSDTVFYLGCSLSYLYTDLAQSRLLDDFPKIGGMKYCCGAYVERYFGQQEIIIKGRELLKRLKKTGIQKLITFCPECDHMLQAVYPSLIDGFDIEVQGICDYLLEQHAASRLVFTNKLNQKVTFHDACGWRSLGDRIYDAPRKLLELMGAEVTEMKHNRKKSLCCGTPYVTKNPQRIDQAADERVAEAKASGAEMIAVGCSGCLSLNKNAVQQDMTVFHITELAQMAIGENPPHRLKEVSKQLKLNVINKFTQNPELLSVRYKIENGKVRQLQ